MLDRRLIKKGNTAITQILVKWSTQILVKWSSLLELLETWECYYILRERFPSALT
jgi:hypothetical protein